MTDSEIMPLPLIRHVGEGPDELARIVRKYMKDLILRPPPAVRGQCDDLRRSWHDAPHVAADHHSTPV